MLLIFYNLPSSGFSKIFVFFIMDNEHAKFFAFFVTNVTTWNFSFLLWFYRHGVTWMFEKLCIALIPPAAWVSGCFFISCPAAWSYTIWPAQQPFKANQELSAALINTAAPPPKESRICFKSQLHVPHLPFFLPSFSGNFLIFHALYLPFLLPTSQFCPFLTHKHEEQSSCSWKNGPQW